MHQGVALATVGQQTVALQHLIIIFINLTDQSGIIGKGIGGHGLVDITRRELGPDCLHTGELAIEHGDVAGILGRLIHIELRGLCHIGKKVGTLI